MRFLKNPKTGVVFPRTEILAEERPDLIECDKHGRTIAPAGVQKPYLLNPIKGDIVPYTAERAAQAGMIPVMGVEEADAVMRDLSGEEVETGGLTPPPLEPPVAAVPSDETDEEKVTLLPEDEAASVVEDSGTNDITDDITEMSAEAAPGQAAPDVNKMDLKELKAFAMTNFGEELDGRKGLNFLREQVLVMINNAAQERGAA